MLQESRRKGILKELEVTKVLELSPKKLKLYRKCRQNVSEILRLRRKFQGVKKKLT